jgi:hypothetical protein
MRVYIGPYKSHWNVYAFQRWYFEKKYKKPHWEIDEDEYDWSDKLVERVSNTWQDVLNVTINKFIVYRKRKEKVVIHKYDTWGMDHTLALIILPMLKQLKATKHGSPYVDDKDVPEHLRSTAAPKLTKKQKDCGHTDDNFHKRWVWVLDEIIWAFEQIVDDNADSQFHSGKSDIYWEKQEGGYSEMKKGPNDTHVFDAEGYKAWNKRIDNGTRLFGKYYRSLWD